MEILAVIGILALVSILFAGGGLLGWGLKAIGEIISLLMSGWTHTFRFIIWIIIILFFLAMFL